MRRCGSGKRIGVIATPGCVQLAHEYHQDSGYTVMRFNPLSAAIWRAEINEKITVDFSEDSLGNS